MKAAHRLGWLVVMAGAGCLSACGATDVAPNGVIPERDGDRPDAGAEANDSPADHAVSSTGHDGPTDGDAPDWQSCSGPGDCVLVSRGCCRGFPLPEDFEAVRRDSAQNWYQMVCPNPSAANCDAAYVIDDKLLAFCVDRRCKMIVAAEDPISACSTDADFTAVASECRFCSFPTAIRADQVATYAAQTCPEADAASVVCPIAPESEGGYPFRVVCGADQHCKTSP